MNRQKGVTLIELMIVVAIVGILAGIAYPSYRAYVMRSHRSDAKVGLERLAQSLERCYTNARTYAGCPALAGAEAGTATSENGYYTIDFSGGPDNLTFTLRATAISGQLADAECRTFTMDNTNARLAWTAGNVANEAVCWRR